MHKKKKKHTSTTQSQLEMYGRQSLQGHFSGFHCFIKNLNFERDSAVFIFSGTSSQIFGARYDTDSVPLNTDLTHLVKIIRSYS